MNHIEVVCGNPDCEMFGVILNIVDGPRVLEIYENWDEEATDLDYCSSCEDLGQACYEEGVSRRVVGETRDE